MCNRFEVGGHKSSKKPILNRGKVSAGLDKMLKLQPCKLHSWPVWLRHWLIQKVPGSNPTRKFNLALRLPVTSRLNIDKTQWLRLLGWGFPLNNVPKLAVGQPNSNRNRKPFAGAVPCLGCAAENIKFCFC